jgi:hypothetical protein
LKYLILADFMLKKTKLSNKYGKNKTPRKGAKIMSVYLRMAGLIPHMTFKA